MGGIDWGDAPTWVAGGFAALAAYYTRGMLRSQQQQIAEQRQYIAQQAMNLALEREALQSAANERKQEQARQVRMEVQALLSSDAEREAPGSRPPSNLLVAHVINESNESVHDVSLSFGREDPAWARHGARKRVPGATRVRGGDGPTWWVATGGNLQSPVSELRAGGACVVFNSGVIGHERVATDRPVVFFTDSAGVRWSLDEYGALKEVTA
ncbi:hypothetical protein [Streptomyces sp. UH6]|uniref:hypothetical protein n=1 Tax=Streptomyces sp. UH6 TaxID=2748379 RepID=UPI0015D4F867|nr:hypothetical protein [Streptomyces sp. UH6]NYV73169.1 hypothetical protein [Streptomyces sp. UH6]